MPIIAPVLLAAKGAAVGSAISSAREGIAGLFGDTATDKQRKSEAAGLTTAALNGDPVALRQLAYNAFEKRTGQPGDNRRPVDGKASPPDTRTLATRGLKQYVAQYGGLPPELGQYAAKLGAPVAVRSPSVVQQLLEPAVNAVTDQALDRAELRATQRAQDFAPYLIVGGVLAVVALYLIVKK